MIQVGGRDRGREERLTKALRTQRLKGEIVIGSVHGALAQKLDNRTLEAEYPVKCRSTTIISRRGKWKSCRFTMSNEGVKNMNVPGRAR